MCTGHEDPLHDTTSVLHNIMNVQPSLHNIMNARSDENRYSRTIRSVTRQLY